MKKIFCLVLLVLLSSTPIFANVFAFDISVQTSGSNRTITYRLNEAATSVQIQIFGPLPATTVIKTITGTTNKGLNTALWTVTTEAGEYGLKITASNSTGHSAWDVISDDTANIFKFYYPRGLAVNKNINSSYFGRIYAVESVGGTVSPRTTQKGIYVINPDGSDPLGQGDAAFAGGVAWVGTTIGPSSPYRVNVGPDDNIYISDWSDTHSGLWRGDADCSGSFIELLDSTGMNSSGLNAVHGSIAVAWIEGTGASTVVYTDDEDFLGGGSASRANSVWKYPIGTGSFPITTPPTVQIDDDVLLKFVNNAGAGLVRDSSGNWYRSQYRYYGTDVGSVFQISSDGTTINWDSLVTGGVNPDPLRGTFGGLCLDEARNRLFVSIAVGGGNATSGFAVVPLPLPVGALDTKITTVAWASANTRCIDCDLAGNVYVIDGVNQRLRIYSPSDGANSYTTTTNLVIAGGVSLTAQPQWSLYQ